MFIPYTVIAPEQIPDIRRPAVVAERAIMLRALLQIEQRSQEIVNLLSANTSIAAVVLGLHPAASIVIAPLLAQQLHDLCLSLAYRMGADLQWISHDDGGFLYNETQVRRILAAQQHRLAHASTSVLRQAFYSHDAAIREILQRPLETLRAETRRLLFRALETQEPLRVRIHAAPPIVVFSTVGMPDLLETTLTAYLTSFEIYEQMDIPICIVDDAKQQAPLMEAAIERLRKRFKNPLIHLNEWQSDGQPGEKARLRQYLAAELRDLSQDNLDEVVEHLFGPGLAGSANFAFWYLRDHAIVWLDQDSSPLTVRTKQTRERPDAATEGYPNLTEQTEIIQTWDDLSQNTPPDICVEPVDVLFLTDWFLDGQPEEVSIRLAEEDWPTREDPGYERVRGMVTESLPPIKICTFHICGHGDYRGRLLHYQLLSQITAPEEAKKILRGNLSFYRVLTAPPASQVVGRSKTAFGTVISFSEQQPILPIPMLATKIRLVDFSVGVLLQGCGPLSVAWAPVGLNHFRAPVTNSGRGSLAPYIWNEDLLWPLLNEVQMTLDDQANQPPGLDRLQAAGKDLSEKGRTYRFPESLSARFFYSALQSRDWLQVIAQTEPWLMEYVEDLERIYYLPSQGSDSVEHAWKVFHYSLERTCQRELQRFGEQLQLWPLIAKVPSPGVRLRSRNSP